MFKPILKLFKKVDENSIKDKFNNRGNNNNKLIFIYISFNNY